MLLRSVANVLTLRNTKIDIIISNLYVRTKLTTIFKENSDTIKKRHKNKSCTTKIIF